VAEQFGEFLQAAEVRLNFLHGDEVEARDDFGDVEERFFEPVVAELAQVPRGEQERAAGGLRRDFGVELCAQTQDVPNDARAFGGILFFRELGVGGHGRSELEVKF